MKGEVCGCDIVAVREGASLLLAIVELKRGFNLELLLQAVDRMRPADEVWVAVPLTRRGRDRDPRVRRLCRLIGLGLMAVDAAHGRVEILAEPGPYKPRSDQRRRTPPAHRAFASPGRSHAGRLDPRAGDDGLSPTRTRLRRRFARRGRPARVICASLPPMPAEFCCATSMAGSSALHPGRYRLTALGEAALQRWGDAACADDLKSSRRAAKNGAVPCL